jgi:hypothetical protein
MRAVHEPRWVCSYLLLSAAKPAQDFYDYKVQGSEGFSKQRLFEILDGLEVRSIGAHCARRRFAFVTPSPCSRCRPSIPVAASSTHTCVLQVWHDSWQERSRPIMEAARQKLAKQKGESALEPWNLSHALSGDVEKCVLRADTCLIEFQLPCLGSASSQEQHRLSSARHIVASKGSRWWP